MNKPKDCLNCKYSQLEGTMTKLYNTCDIKPKFKRNLPDEGDDFRHYFCDKYEAKQ